MVKLPITFATILVAGLAMPTASYSANEVSPEVEFKRALSIIKKTQLEIFTDSRLQNAEEISLELVSRSDQEIDKLDSSAADYAEQIKEKRIEIMRTLLTEVIDEYNDQYANYIPPKALTKYSERRSGSYEGVGLKFRTVAEDYPLVVGPIIGGPLSNSDLKPGDKIIEANQKDLKGLSSREVVATLKGPAESAVQLNIKRGDKTHVVSGRRGPVDLHYARSEIIAENIGYIQISRFGGKTHQRVAAQLKNLLKQDIEGIILDLRNNPGGSTRAARAIVSMFSKENHVYCEKHKSGAIKQLPRHGAHVTDLPLAVLVNGDSMSSSEIVSGALQTYGRGVIIGSPTYGKGLVQRVFNLKKPLGGAIRTTIAVFGRPDHETIHGAGIVPDIFIETPADFMFRRVGSLNIEDDARAFQRTLLEQGVREKHPDKAQALIAATDKQLETAIAQIEEALNTHPDDATQTD